MLWADDWEYGAGAIILCVTLHSLALIGLARLMFHEKMRRFRQSSLLVSSFMFAIFALVAIALHAAEAAIWAALYLHIGAVDDFPSGYLHSLGAFTTLGDSTVLLDLRWRLLIQLEALNGAVALGLTTALLYSSARRVQRIIDGSS
jgi:hypothetical protein